MSFDYTSLNLRALMTNILSADPQEAIKLDLLKEGLINKIKSGEIRSIIIDEYQYQLVYKNIVNSPALVMNGFFEKDKK